jgi:hypothetical protein
MVNAADEVELGPVDFEHPAAHARQSVASSARIIKPQDDWLETGRLKSFEHIPIFLLIRFVAHASELGDIFRQESLQSAYVLGSFDPLLLRVVPEADDTGLVAPL